MTSLHFLVFETVSPWPGTFPFSWMINGLQGLHLYLPHHPKLFNHVPGQTAPLLSSRPSLLCCEARLCPLLLFFSRFSSEPNVFALPASQSRKGSKRKSLHNQAVLGRIKD